MFDRDTVVRLQSFLRRKGADDLCVDGTLGNQTMNALQRYLRLTLGPRLQDSGLVLESRLDAPRSMQRCSCDHCRPKTCPRLSENVQVLILELCRSGPVVGIEISLSRIIQSLKAFLDEDSAKQYRLSQLMRVANDGNAYAWEDFVKYYSPNEHQKWYNAADMPVTHVMPKGLSLAGVKQSSAKRALDELRPLFAHGCNVFNIGWEWDGRDAWSGKLSDFLHVHALLKESHEEFARQGIPLGRPLESGIILTCRRYWKGQNLQFHVDRNSDAEDVYGCVLENTSHETLEFHRKVKGHSCFSGWQRYITYEYPGFCYHLEGEARYGWAHGVLPLRQGERFSLSWRWLKENAMMPEDQIPRNTPGEMISSLDAASSVDVMSESSFVSVNSTYSGVGMQASVNNVSPDHSGYTGKAICFFDPTDYDYGEDPYIKLEEGNDVKILKEEDDWAYGLVWTREEGWFPREFVKIHECRNALSESCASEVGSLSGVSGASFSSQGSSVGWSSKGDCYAPETMFMKYVGLPHLPYEQVSAYSLHVGDSVLTSDGQVTRMTRKVTHEDQRVREIQVGDLSLRVTPTHRIAGVDGGEILAKDLHVGHPVMVSDGTATVTCINDVDDRTQVFALTFEPDVPIMSYFPKKSAILSLGQKPRTLKPTRRSGMNKRTSSDVLSIPETEPGTYQD